MAAPERTGRAGGRTRIGRVLPPSPLRALVTMATFTAVLYLVEVADTVTGSGLESNGIVPREVHGLDGVLWAPLLHGPWAHLAANTVPFLLFGFLAMAGGIGQFVAVTATIWVLGGLGTWLTGTDGVHLGASGLIFGWLAFLLARGFFARRLRQIALAVLLFAFWGGVLFAGVLPGQPNISWQGHLFGALAGLLAAWLVARADRSRRPAVGAAP